jgi:hypothetical protein
MFDGQKQQRDSQPSNSRKRQSSETEFSADEIESAAMTMQEDGQIDIVA